MNHTQGVFSSFDECRACLSGNALLSVYSACKRFFADANCMETYQLETVFNCSKLLEEKRGQVQKKMHDE